MDRIIDRMERVHRGRDHLQRDFDHDVRRTPIWHWLRGGAQEDFRKLYGALRSVGMEVSFRPVDGPRRFDGEGIACELRYGHRVWEHRFSPMVMDRSADAQNHMIETLVTGAQSLFIEVALDNVMDNDHSVMPYRDPIGVRRTADLMGYIPADGRTVRQRPDGTYEDARPSNLHRVLREDRTAVSRRDRPGFHAVMRPAADYRVPPPATAELRANAGADLEHLDVVSEHLDDAPERTFGPSEEALVESYRV